MARFNSRALQDLSRALGIASGQVTTDQVDLSNVSLVLDVASLVSSGRGVGFHGGWGVAEFTQVRNTTGFAGVTFDPYNSASSVNGFPVTLPDDFDLWVYDAELSKSAAAIAGTGNFFEAGIITPIDFAAYVPPLTSASVAQRWFAAGTSFIAGNLVASVSPLESKVHPIFPQILVRNGSLFLSSTLDASFTGTVTLTATFLLRAIPKGLRP